MNETVVHFTDSRTFGGAEREMMHLIRGLAETRWRPIILHHGDPGLWPLLDEARAVSIEARSIPRMHGLAVGPRAVAFMRALRVLRPTVFHAHQSWPLAAGAALVAASTARIPARLATTQLFGELPPSVLLAAGHRVISGSVHRFIAVSAAVAARLRSRFRVPETKLRVIPNGIDIARDDAPASTDERRDWLRGGARHVVLTLARLDIQKGHAYLIDAATQLPGVVVVLAGEGPLRGALESQAARLGLSERVIFLGQRADVAGLIAASDVVVLPSLWEGLPLAVLEAMAGGKAVVATAIGGTDEAVVHRRTGILVPPKDPAALAAAIREVLSDDTLAAALGGAGRERAIAEFSSATMVSRVTALYDEILEARAGRDDD